MVKYAPETFGKHGFKRPAEVVTEVSAVNLWHIDQQAERLLEEKLASREGDVIRVDVTKMGFDKVLGAGRITKKLIIEAKSFSEEAKRKIEEAGGQAVVIEKKKAMVDKEAEKVEEKKEVKRKEVKKKETKTKVQAGKKKK